ncbi:quercetin 2,3-dioxygenase [Paenibacillus sp. J31TS4]|uniref:pirin family protein n=1 Tax=Paenibacillus sp. J31TS4 TaxID=2807195 RepID=UPI001B2DF897|nr:pirin family protein [Paenibacillus sp. J31TS4]GIP37350.1 quercetin 2,3-dioxygenase [Paenibacillus sp. J31TS4]
MINVYPASSRRSVDLGWLSSSYSFSYGEYYDPDNQSFGALRVLNDETLLPKRGVGAHPHREMEMVTLVLKGKLKSEDNLGKIHTAGFGEVLRISAGTGLQHAESNPGEEAAHYLQLWFLPETAGLPPSTEVARFDPAGMRNKLLPVVSPEGGAGTARIHQDATLFLSDLDPIHMLAYEQEPGRRLYLKVLEGSLIVNGTRELGRRDAARIEGVPDLLLLGGRTGARFLLIDLQ